jgi:hypothetical protein
METNLRRTIMAKKKSYNKMYVQEEPQTVPEVAPEPVVEAVPEAVAEPKVGAGVVVGCVKLNVREHPSADADVLCMLPVMSQVLVDLENKYDDWFHVFTAAGQEGYCMKRFIEVK